MTQPRWPKSVTMAFPKNWGKDGTCAIVSPLLSESQLGMLPPLGVVSPPGQAGGEALERSLVLYTMDAGVAVKGFIPEAMSLRGISDI